MTTITINGQSHEISDDLARSLSDALLTEVARCASTVKAYKAGPADDSASVFEPAPEVAEAVIAEATRDGIAAQAMHGSLWGYSGAEVDARWQDALYIAR